MQQNLAQLEEELEFLRERLSSSEEERDWALNELKRTRKEAEEANLKLQEAFTPRKMPEIYTELNSVKKLLASATQELKTKESDIETLRIEAEKPKQLELKIAEKDAALKKLSDQLAELRNSISDPEDKKRIGELEEELAGRKEAESKVFESLIAMTKELEQTKISLAESKHEIFSLREKLEGFSSGSGSSRKSGSKDISSKRNCFRDSISMEEKLESLNSELQTARENLARAQDGEKQALVKAQNLLGEIGKLRNELKSANEAEENGKKALDDLALALKEVATELGEVKLKHDLALAELEHWRGEADNVKSKARSSEEKYRTLLDEARKEAEKYKNTAERLRLEAEESLLAWNDKETMFVGCIRRAEEEKTLAQQENIRLLENIRAADKMVRSSKEENIKLRDILKQAINEANVAKEAASIAKAENSQLKDGLAEKDDALDFLTREVEILRANEIAGMENIKELKRLIAEAPPPQTEEKDLQRSFRKQGSMEKEQTKDGRKLGKAFSFNLKELRIHTKHRDLDSGEDNNSSNSSKSKDGEGNKAEEADSHEDKDSPADPLKGSIFDAVDSPVSAAHHRKKSSSGFTSDGESVNPDELDHLEAAHLDDLENGRFSRRRSRLLKRFGDLLIRKRSYSEIKHNR
ncbi:WEB family protein At3g02930, chloroplastic isoform X2 [Punica granatum]|nr:WEB family protein At3g02930, chloroplastic isoform X2 [Punica granatum]PKI66197.1 hypothetical protein CRG98_013365 [Punica granatum]